MDEGSGEHAVVLRGARILVTGAGGFIGVRLVGALAAAGAEPHAVVRLRGWTGPRSGAQVHAADVAGRSIGALVGALRPAVVIHLAVARDDATPAARLEAVRTNVIGTAQLLEAAARAGVRRFVHVGGSLEYGPTDGPMGEDATVCPQGYYGATKAAASALAIERAEGGDLHTVVLRPFLVYGPGQPGDRLVPTVLRAARDGGELALTGPGPARDWVYVDDVVAACLAAATTAALSPGAVVNVGSGGQWTNEDVVTLAREVTGRPIAVRTGAYAPRPWDRATWRADSTLLRSALGIAPRTLRQGLTATWQEWCR